MRSWLFWAGVGFIVGGAVSYGLNAGAGSLAPLEDISGYSIGWIGAGAILLVVGLVLRSPKPKQA